MPEPLSPRKAPYAVEVEEGKTYYWCACGRSKNQPFCDGSHQGTGFEPVGFTAEKTDTVYLCGCKKTGNKPFCDGTHNKL
ncbi:CDGSH iron-sulfur domain-containing protein [Kaarinaea lacus]